MIHLLSTKATRQQLDDMLKTLGAYVKLAVDIERAVAAGGGELHADCETVLLRDGSQQAAIWGAYWIPATQEIRFEALINIRPRQNNRSMYIQDATIRTRVEQTTRALLEGV
jgi:hypothetical protein